MSAPGAEAYRRTQAQLFLLGAAKSGTTTLAHWLAAQPDVLLSHPKEPYFFELFYDRGLDDYWDSCFGPWWAGESIVLDARHRNLFLPYVPARINESAPNPLFIAILREPAARAHSHWWHWRARGIEMLDFADAIRVDWERVQAGIDFAQTDGPDLWARAHPTPGRQYNAMETLQWRTYVDTGFYAQQLARYFELFGRERVLVLYTDDLAEDPGVVRRRIADFVGLSGDDRSELEWQNRALEAPAGVRVPAAAEIPIVKSVVRSVLPGQVYRRVRERLVRPAEVPVADHRTQVFLSQLYEPHNVALAKLLDRPVPCAWTA